MGGSPIEAGCDSVERGDPPTQPRSSPLDLRGDPVERSGHPASRGGGSADRGRGPIGRSAAPIGRSGAHTVMRAHPVEPRSGSVERSGYPAAIECVPLVGNGSPTTVRDVSRGVTSDPAKRSACSEARRDKQTTSVLVTAHVASRQGRPALIVRGNARARRRGSAVVKQGNAPVRCGGGPRQVVPALAAHLIEATVLHQTTPLSKALLPERVVAAHRVSACRRTVLPEHRAFDDGSFARRVAFCIAQLATAVGCGRSSRVTPDEADENEKTRRS